MHKILAVAILAAGLYGGTARAADHRDGPGVDTDATVDITDVYAWMSADGSKVYLILNLQGANTGAVAGTTKFSNTALYALHVSSTSAFGMPSVKNDTIICKFDGNAMQGFQCWGPGTEYVSGMVGDKAGALSLTGRMKAAALVRDDPFWFNIRGFIDVATTVHAVAGTLMFDAAGCPTIDNATSGVLVNKLTDDGATPPNPGTDDFGKNGKAPVGCVTGKCDKTAVTNGNVLSIVLSVDKSLLTTGGPVVTVWGSTNMAK